MKANIFWLYYIHHHTRALILTTTLSGGVIIHLHLSGKTTEALLHSNGGCVNPPPITILEPVLLWTSKLCDETYCLSITTNDIYDFSP